MLSLEQAMPVLELAPAKLAPVAGELTSLTQCHDLPTLLSGPTTAAAAPISTLGLDPSLYVVQMVGGCAGIQGIPCVGLTGGTICCPCYQSFPAASAPAQPCTAIATATVPTVTAITTAYPQQPVTAATLSQQPNGTFHPTQLSGVTRQQLTTAQSLKRQLHPGFHNQQQQQQQQNGASSPNFHGKFRPRYNRSPLGFLSRGTKRKADDAVSTDSTDSGNGRSDCSSTTGDIFLQPLYCKICRVTLNAPAQAKQHYEGKNHAKKVKLTDCPSNSENSSSSTTTAGTDQVPNSPASGSTPPSDSPPSPPAPINPEIYCRTCGVSFNSDKQAQQHYQGKNHAKKVRATDGERGRAGYRRGSRFRCYLCNLHLGSKEHLLTHLRGPRHQERVKAQGPTARVQGLGTHWHNNDLTMGVPFGITQLNGGPGTNRHGYLRSYHHGNSHMSPGNRKSRDFSMFRTPSNKFYCPACDFTVATEGLFAQHMDSRRHRAESSRHGRAGSNGTHRHSNAATPGEGRYSSVSRESNDCKVDAQDATMATESPPSASDTVDSVKCDAHSPSREGDSTQGDRSCSVTSS